MKIQFADTIADVFEFRVKRTYEGITSGTRAAYSKHIIELEDGKAIKKEGNILIQSFCDDAKNELKDLELYLDARVNFEKQIFITWFVDDIPDSANIKDLIENVTKSINFYDNYFTYKWY